MATIRSEGGHRPRPRGDKRERTRQALIAATLQVMQEKGFAAATLEEIARRVGMSRGAIYSNFPSRADLVLAAISTTGMQLDRNFDRPVSLKEQLRRFALNLVDQLPTAAGPGRWIIDFGLYAVNDPDLRARFAAGYGAGFRRNAEQFAALYGEELAIDPASLALAVQGLAMGFVWQFILTPEEVTPAAVLQAFEALAAGATKG